jgi:hypothetical protein
MPVMMLMTGSMSDSRLLIETDMIYLFIEAIGMAELQEIQH